MKQLALAHLSRELFHKACIPYRNTAYHSVLAPILLHWSSLTPYHWWGEVRSWDLCSISKAPSKEPILFVKSYKPENSKFSTGDAQLKSNKKRKKKMRFQCLRSYHSSGQQHTKASFNWLQLLYGTTWCHGQFTPKMTLLSEIITQLLRDHLLFSTCQILKGTI